MALKINFIRKVRIYAMIEAKVTMELPAEKKDVLKARKYGMNAKN